MKIRSTIVVVVMAVCVFAVEPVFAQGTPPSDSVECSELASLVEVNQELVKVLRFGVDQKGREIDLKKLELAIEYLQFRARKAENLESLLMQTDRYREALVESVAKYEELIEGLNDDARKASGPEAEEIFGRIATFQRSIKGIEDRLANNERSAIDLRNQITDERRSLQFLEDFISENLDLGN